MSYISLSQKDTRVFIIAEAGVNHNGDVRIAKKLVDAAREAGADAVKFQTFKAESLATEKAPKAVYQLSSGTRSETQFEMLKRLEISYQSLRDLNDYCRERDILFMSSPFDNESLHFLCDHLGMGAVKIPSGEITNAPLLLEAGRKGVPLIVSTGMASLGEIEDALGVLSFSLSGCKERPSPAAFRKAYASPGGQAALQSCVTLLHCTSEYPAPFAELNLRSVAALRSGFGVRTGLSDHSEGHHAAVASVALGATVIEKHFTLDRTMEGPDHKASLDPQDLNIFIRLIRETEEALGNGVKIPYPSEARNKEIVRKSLVANCSIHAGEEFTADNISSKRPAQGKSPFAYWDIIGTKAARDYAEGEPL